MFSMTTVEYLPLSPSLIDFMIYLKYKDIKNVRLVNRRMNDVIKRSGSLLDRPTVSLELKFNHQNEEYVAVSCYKWNKEWLWHGNVPSRTPLFSFCVTERRIRLIDYPPAIEEYLLENGILMEFDKEHSDKKLLEQHIGREYYNKYRDFATRNIEAGLQFVLHMLFRLCFLEGLSIDNEHEVLEGTRAAKWIGMISEEFRGSYSKCRELYVSKECFGVEKLYTTLGSNVSLNLGSLRIEDILPMQRFDRTFLITAFPNPVESPLCFVNLVKQWSSGSISIKRLLIGSFCSFPKNQLLRSLRGLPIVYTKNKTGEIKWLPMEIVLQRSSDNLYLRIEYGSDSTLTLEECTQP